jgi:hypothetical protein
VHLVAVQGVNLAARRVSTFVQFGGNGLIGQTQQQEGYQRNAELHESAQDVEQPATLMTNLSKPRLSQTRPRLLDLTSTVGVAVGEAIVLIVFQVSFAFLPSCL